MDKWEIAYVVKGERHQVAFDTKDAAVDWLVRMYHDEPSFAVVWMALHRERALG